MKASSKISNLRRDLIMEFQISKDLQSEFIDIAEDVRKLEFQLEKVEEYALFCIEAYKEGIIKMPDFEAFLKLQNQTKEQ